MLEDKVDQSSLPEGADGLQGLTALRESPIFLLSQLFQSQTSKLHFEEERYFMNPQILPVALSAAYRC